MNGRGRDTLTSTEAGELLGVSAATVKRWSDDGALPSIRTRGGHRRFRRADVEDAAARQRGADGANGTLAERLVEGEPVLRVQAELLAERARGGSWRAVLEECVSVLRTLALAQRADGFPHLAARLAHGILADALARCCDELPLIPGAPTAVLAAVEDEPFAVPLAVARLGVRAAGWTAWAVGAVTTPELTHFAARRQVDAILLFASVSRSRAVLEAATAALEPACAAAGVALGLFGGGPFAATGTARIIRSFGEVVDFVEDVASRRASVRFTNGQ